MNPVHVIGDADTVLAFALGGVPGDVARSADEARSAVMAAVAAVQRGGGPVHQPILVLVTASVAQSIRADLDALILDANAPLILEFPGFHDAPSASPVERFVERVLGVHR